MDKRECWLWCGTAAFTVAALATVVVSSPEMLSNLETDDTQPVVLYRTESDTVHVNINTADAAELTKIPGVNVSLAEEIIRYRSAHGAFNAKEDLKEVVGMDLALYLDIEKHIVIG